MDSAGQSEKVPGSQIEDSAAVVNEDAVEGRNILTLVLHQIFFRTAWIFKTESVIMPAFLDTITDAGWVRGLLPPLNRIGQSVAPLLLSDRLRQAPRKLRWLSRGTFCMGLPFVLIGTCLWAGMSKGSLLVVVFLASYFVFFCLNGITQATFNTIQGKLIRPRRRGRLIALAGFVGSPVAVTMALLLLRPWTQSTPPKFAWIFLFTGVVFLLASTIARFLIEEPDPEERRSRIRVVRRFREAWSNLQSDPHLRSVCVIAALFVSSQVLFPHYQRLGQSLSDFDGRMLMIWVIAQNLSAAFFSWLSGRIADARGTRAALRWLTFVATFAPLGSLFVEQLGHAAWFWFAYVLLGAVPVTYRMFLNYVLELTDRANHPIYVSTVVLCMAPPILLSPLVGELVARFGYTGPFLGVTCLLVIAWTLTLRIVEPRTLREQGESEVRPHGKAASVRAEGPK